MPRGGRIVADAERGCLAITLSFSLTYGPQRIGGSRVVEALEQHYIIPSRRNRIGGPRVVLDYAERVAQEGAKRPIFLAMTTKNRQGIGRATRVDSKSF